MSQQNHKRCVLFPDWWCECHSNPAEDCYKTDGVVDPSLCIFRRETFLLHLTYFLLTQKGECQILNLPLKIKKKRCKGLDMAWCVGLKSVQFIMHILQLKGRWNILSLSPLLLCPLCLCDAHLTSSQPIPWGPGARLIKVTQVLLCSALQEDCDGGLVEAQGIWIILDWQRHKVCGLFYVKKG